MSLPEGVELATEDGVGRHVKTQKALAQGDVVMHDTPLVSCATPPEKVGAPAPPTCWHCQRALTTIGSMQLPKFLTDDRYKKLWPNDAAAMETCKCCGATYCSAACRKASRAQYHGVECGMMSEVRELFDWLRDNRGANFDYTAAVLLAVRMFLMIQQDPAAAERFDTYERVEPLQLDARLDHYAPALNKCLAACGASVDDPAFRSALLVALTNSMTFVCSPKHVFFDRVQKQMSATVSETQIDPLALLTPSERGEVEGLTEGVGLYPLLSMVNHSCLPTCGINAVATEDHTLRLVGLRATPAGGPVTISYLAMNPDVPDNDKLLHKEKYSILYRRGQLMPHWRFDCRCTLCCEQMDVIKAMVDWVVGTLLDRDAAAAALSAKYTMNTPVDDEYDTVVDELDSEGATAATIEKLRVLATTHAHQPSYHTLACLHYYGHPALEARDNKEAMRCFAIASVLNNGYTLNGRLSWAALSELLFDEIAAANGNGAYLDGSILLLRAAADQGDARAQASLAFYLSENYMQEAWQWVETAISQGGQPQALHLAASWARDGKGLDKPNLQMAIALFERARKEGYPLSDDEARFVETGGQG
eukprot:TRINITY_DN9298_c0_g1_i1.p1 TRINITY_DN9298_c0_g1~~TRINITY_DN9298_c0_g1_i1.p1  ORF type:complete len:592 (+),score=176.83 TRINITY_DN9298_c0_g1_i1:173-1948(+)